jgi:hypothetical protein
MSLLNCKYNSLCGVTRSENQKFRNISRIKQHLIAVPFLKVFFLQLAAEVGKLLP